MANVTDRIATLTRGLFEPHEEEADRLRQHARDGRSVEVPADALEVRGDLLVDTHDGTLWKVAHDFQPSGRAQNPSRVFVVEGTPPTPRWLDPATPRTLPELEALEQAKREQAEERRLAEEKRLAALSRRAVTLSDIEERTMPTLAQAAATVRASGGLHVVDGHLVVEIADAAVNMYARSTWMDNVTVLCCAEAFVVAELEAGRDLPDVQITPNGRPAQ